MAASARFYEGIFKFSIVSDFGERVSRTSGVRTNSRMETDFSGVIAPAKTSVAGALVLSFEMSLPGAERAVVDVEKIRDYCLNPAHPRGRHKSRVFASALGLSQEDAEWLRDELLKAVLHGDAAKSGEDEYGHRYVLDFECERHDRSVVIRSGWIVRRGEDFPRFNTCYVLSE